MADNVALTTIGVKIGYCLPANLTRQNGVITAVKSSVWLQDMKSAPAVDGEAEALETTTLANTDFKSYEQGLKDMGGSQEFTANRTERLITEWGNFYAGTTALNEEGAIVIWHPSLTNMTVLPCKPQKLGSPEVGVNSVWEQTVRVTPTSEPVEVAKVEPTAPATQSAVVGGGD